MNKRYPLYVVLGIVALLLIWGATVYNGLVNRDEKVKQRWSEVENAYQRRLDLIPSLVSTVRGGADYEQSVLRQVTEARSRAISSAGGNVAENEADYKKVTNAQDSLAAASNRLIVALERYPDIKGTKAFTGLQTQLERTELRIKLARKDFNAAVADYNQHVKRFPGNLIAGVTGFHSRDGFEAVAGADQSIDIKF